MGARAVFQVFEGGSGWYWRLRGANGEIVCQSEAYDQKSAALKAVKRLPSIATGAKVEVVS